jgi:hypothetical protein
MTTNEVRDALHRKPFHPFTIRAASGEEVDVPHPEFLAFSRSGRTISVALRTGGFAILDLLLVDSLKNSDANGTRPKRKRR